MRCFFKDICKPIVSQGGQKDLKLGDYVLDKSKNKCYNQNAAGELPVVLSYCPPKGENFDESNSFIKMMCTNLKGDLTMTAKIYMQSNLNCQSAIIPNTTLALVGCRQAVVSYTVGFKEVAQFTKLCASAGAQLTGIDALSGGLVNGDSIGTCNQGAISNIAGSLGNLGNLFGGANNANNPIPKYAKCNPAVAGGAPAPAPGSNPFSAFGIPGKRRRR
jgi:hypothetical protein